MGNYNINFVVRRQKCMLFYIKENSDNLPKISEFLNTSTYEKVSGQRLSFFQMGAKKIYIKKEI